MFDIFCRPCGTTTRMREQPGSDRIFFPFHLCLSVTICGFPSSSSSDVSGLDAFLKSFVTSRLFFRLIR